MAAKPVKQALLFHRIRLRASNCYLLVGDGAILIDAGLGGEGTF
jgi:glyoxylase-like metal-dependent hydrolase (beta-lactamase superfamily II)